MVCGYRSAQTNARLRRNNRQGDSHVQGQVVDIRIPGVELSRIRNAGLSLNRGGVGYYPRSNFVHIDTGPTRHW